MRRDRQAHRVTRGRLTRRRLDDHQRLQHRGERRGGLPIGIIGGPQSGRIEVVDLEDPCSPIQRIGPTVGRRGVGGNAVAQSVLVRPQSLEGLQDCSVQGCAGWPHGIDPGLNPRLADDLPLPVGAHHRGHLAMESAIHEGHREGGMVVVITQGIGVPPERIQPRRHRPVGLGQPEDGVTVHGEGDREVGPERVGQVQRGRMVVVIVGPAAVATPLIQFSDEGRYLAAIVGRVEDGNAVGCERDRPLEEGLGGDGLRLGRLHRFHGQSPLVRAKIIGGHRDLTLPGGDALHHAVVGHAIRTHMKLGRIPPEPQHRLEPDEGPGLEVGLGRGLRVGTLGQRPQADLGRRRCQNLIVAMPVMGPHTACGQHPEQHRHHATQPANSDTRLIHGASLGKQHERIAGPMMTVLSCKTARKIAASGPR